jgi:hypothetical protein
VSPVPDDRDDCPNVPGPASNKGCPTDRDGDGVPDNLDKCPDIPGRIVNAGCPDPDRDKDGVPDDEDNCPDVPGPVGPPTTAARRQRLVRLPRSRTHLLRPRLRLQGRRPKPKRTSTNGPS